MKNRPVRLCVLLWHISVSVRALDTVVLLQNGSSKTLLEQKDPILAEAAGTVPVPFSKALVLIETPTLLNDVQNAYRGLMMDEGEEPEFTIQQNSTNTYFYVNRDGERTDITEVLRRRTAENAFDIVYYSKGERFFGDYQAVIHVQVSPSGATNSTYAASVYAYPENAVSRFFARRLGLVKRFFKKKTAEMSGIITAITCSLCDQVPEESATVTTNALVSVIAESD
ncbi:MAG: hypothetical protein JXR25_08375 [Pontiellaceae bacterium]|nr:hypothetical protein [Pontiellaceae bacterium]MBN2784829.1 hypothetical protein [Pontiellaceae bacterium]